MKQTKENYSKGKEPGSTILAYLMHGGAHPLPQGGPPRTWSHHKPETNQTGQQNRQSLTKSNQISVSPSEPRERYKKGLPSRLPFRRWRPSSPSWRSGGRPRTRRRAAWPPPPWTTADGRSCCTLLASLPLVLTVGWGNERDIEQVRENLGTSRGKLS